MKGGPRKTINGIRMHGYIRKTRPSRVRHRPARGTPRPCHRNSQTITSIHAGNLHLVDSNWWSASNSTIFLEISSILPNRRTCMKSPSVATRSTVHRTPNPDLRSSQLYRFDNEVEYAWAFCSMNAFHDNHARRLSPHARLPTSVSAKYLTRASMTRGG